MTEVPELLVDDASEDLYERKVIKTDKGQEPYRIDKFLMNRIEGATRNKIQNAIEAGLVTVNGHSIKPNYKVHPHDVLTVSRDRSEMKIESCVLFRFLFGAPTARRQADVPL